MHGISNSTMSKAAGRAGRLAEAMTLVRRVLAETRQAGIAADGERHAVASASSVGCLLDGDSSVGSVAIGRVLVGGAASAVTCCMTRTSIVASAG
jgi:hypothetical protein